MSDYKEPHLLEEALAAINAKRRIAGLPELAAFGQFFPETPPDSQDLRKAELEAGQAQLLKRRMEHGILPPAPSPDNAVNTLTLRQVLDQLQPNDKKPSSQSKKRWQKKPGSQTSKGQTVKVWSKLGLAASRRNLSGAIRAWTIAQNLDSSGSGVVSNDALLAFLEQIGSTRSTRYRWIREAVKAGFLCPVRGGNRYTIRAIKRVCESVEVDEPGQRIEVQAQAFGRSGWKGLLWAGNLVGRSHPVSRAFLQKTTGIPVRTQKTYDKAAHITAKANYAVDMTSRPELIGGYREFSRSHAFIVPCGGTKRIAFRLPNTYQVPSTIRKAGGLARSHYIRQQVAQLTVSVISESEAPTVGCSASGGREGNFSAGGASHGTSRRLYFDRASDLRKMVHFRNRKGLEVDKGDYYTFMAGGIARRIRYFGCQWWMLEKEKPSLC